MSHPMAQQRPPQFSSATLGRPRPSDIKRTDPLIFAQVNFFCAMHHFLTIIYIFFNQFVHFRLT